MALKNRVGFIKIIEAIECMQKSLSCAICLEISLEPVETRCGHLFCRGCIQKLLSHPGESCPVCKFHLTRRNISPSDHMGLCIQQLSILIDAVRSDTDIDVTACLKMDYKKRAFLPSAPSSSPQSQQEVQNNIPSLELDNNTKKNPQKHEDSTDLEKQATKLASQESPIKSSSHKPAEQTIDNSSCKIMPRKCQLDATPVHFTAINSLGAQNENVSPPENISSALIKSKSTTEIHQFDSQVNNEIDTAFEENRQCLKDISTLNLNRSLTDQSTKTWSRIARFGKELRRKSGRNLTKIHKKPKLSVNVRDKSVLLNTSHDHSTDREMSGHNGVDHGTNINHFVLNKHNDDVDVSVSQMKNTVAEKVNAAKLNQDDEMISKTNKQVTLITVNGKICDDNVDLNPNAERNERLSNSVSAISGPQMKKGPKKMVQEKQKLSDISLPFYSLKTIIPVKLTDKQSSEAKRNVPESSSAADSGESLSSEKNKSKRSSQEKEKVSDATPKTNSEIAAVPESRNSELYEKKRINSDVSPNDFEKLIDTANKGSKRLFEEQGTLAESSSPSAGEKAETANVGETVVRFKKLGHLFRMQRKSVVFLFLGSMKPHDSEISSDSGSTNICKLCQLSEKSILLQAQRFGPLGRLGRAKSFESANFNRLKQPLPEIFTSPINRSDGRENPSQMSSALKKQTISLKNHRQPRCLSKCDRSQSDFTEIADETLQNESEPLESSITRRKRKRSQPSDHEDQCIEDQNEKRVSKKRSQPSDHEDQCTEDQNEKRVSKKRSQPSDHENQCIEEQTEKTGSKKLPESLEPQEQRTKKQREECVPKNQLKASDSEDRCPINPSRKCVSHELAHKENDEYFRVDSLLNKTLHSQALALISSQAEQLSAEGKDTTGEVKTPEHENKEVEPVKIDFRIENALQERNITLRGNFPKTLPKPISVTTPDVPKNINCVEARDLVDLKTRQPPETYSDVIAQNSDIYEHEVGSEFNLSSASMMNVTGEELLLKKFEEHLFGPKKCENVQTDDNRNEHNKVWNENTTDALVMRNRTLMPETLDQSVSIPTGALMEHNLSHKVEDFIELTPSQQNSTRLNNPPDIIQKKESVAIQPNVETRQGCEENKTAATPLRKTRESEKTKGHTSSQSITKMRPIYQSTPRSSQVSTDRYRLSVYRQMKQNARSPIQILATKDFPRSSKLNSLANRRGCILCSGLTSKQSEDVRYLSSLLDMQYTNKFSNDVTHVIVKTNDDNNGACKTLKYLQGVAYRKWVLNFKWIVDCMAEKKLLNEAPYEVVDSTTLIAGPKKARRGEKGPFDGFVFYCVEPFHNISVPDYEDLLRQMGATVVRSLNDLAVEESIFKIIAVQAECHENKLMNWHQISKAVPVAQEWIVECISQYRLVSFLPFLQELSPQDILDLGFPEELIQDDDGDFMYDVST